MSFSRSFFLAASVLGLLAALPFGWAGSGRAEEPSAVEKKKVSEFLSQFVAIKDKKERAQAVFQLKGLKEKSSLRAIAGLLADTQPEVRRNVCQVIRETPDMEGYFVKPLLGMLYDTNKEVREAGLECLSESRMKGQAVKGLVMHLEFLSKNRGTEPELPLAIHKALKKLTGHPMSEAKDLQDLAKQWKGVWEQKKAEIEKTDAAALPKAPPASGTP